MNEHRGTYQIAPTKWRSSRRAFAAGLRGGLVAALLARAGYHTARAQATPPTLGPPRRYVLKGGGIAITYEPAVRLDYHDATGQHSVSGQHLREERIAPLGQLVTIFVDAVADASTRYLTLLVPDVNRDENGGDVGVQTVVIVTTKFTNLGGPAFVEGALQKYEAVALDGMAEFGPSR